LGPTSVIIAGYSSDVSGTKGIDSGLPVRGGGATVPEWGTGAGSDSDFTDVSPLPCSQEATSRSMTGDTPTLLKITNNRREAVQKFWIDYEGKRAQPETIAPEAFIVIRTFMTHPFVIADDAGNCIAVYQPIKGPGHATLAP